MSITELFKACKYETVLQLLNVNYVRNINNTDEYNFFVRIFKNKSDENQIESFIKFIKFIQSIQLEMLNEGLYYNSLRLEVTTYKDSNQLGMIHIKDCCKIKIVINKDIVKQLINA